MINGFIRNLFGVSISRSNTAPAFNIFDAYPYFYVVFFMFIWSLLLIITFHFFTSFSSLWFAPISNLFLSITNFFQVGNVDWITAVFFYIRVRFWELKHNPFIILRILCILCCLCVGGHPPHTNYYTTYTRIFIILRILCRKCSFSLLITKT